jgi:trehalose/maltose hydrolase-like predicted phosphorylase
VNHWVLRFDGYNPDDETRREALCTTGNGLFATRGAWPGSRADGVHYPGTYLAGCYNRLRDDVAGRSVENESLVNLPDWLVLSVAIEDGPWLTPDTAEVLEYAAELDLRRGVLTRRFRLRDELGRIVSGQERRFVSMSDAHLAGQALTVTAEGWSGLLRVRSGVDGRVHNAGVDRYRALSGQHLTIVNRVSRCEDGVTMVGALTTQSRIRVAVAARSVVSPCERRWPVGGGRDALQETVVHVAAGDQVTVSKVAAVYSSRDPAVSEPFGSALAAVAATGFDDLLERHALAWSRLWRRFDLDLEEPADGTLLAVRFNLFHLLQSTSPHSVDADAGIPARGLHGEAYRGHVFWDELFVFPVLTLRMPELTRALLRYRWRRLPAARNAARAAGLRGAMYPWQSGSDGREESQRYHLNPLSGHWTEDVTVLQRHVGLAVAYTMWQYAELTGDDDFLSEHGAEVILEVARCFAALAGYDPVRDRYVIRGVVGPDEFHTGYPGAGPAGIDNNAYTNILAVWVLRRAADVLERLPGWRRTEVIEAIGLRPGELVRWDDLSRRMYVPFHDGVISQFEGYGELAELDWADYRRRYGDIRRLDRILEAEGRSVNDYRVSKQADVLMLLYLLGPDELADLMDRLGYPLSPATIRRTIRYYLDRTSHGSTLSAVVHAWGLAGLDPDRALAFLDQTLRSDTGDRPRGTTAEGIHLAAMAGGVDLLQRRLTGLDARGDELRFDPRWPARFGRLRMALQYRGHRLTVEVCADCVEVRAEPGPAGPITVCINGVRRELRAGGSVTG